MMIALTPVFAMTIVMRKYLMGQQIILLMKTNQQTNQKKRIVMKPILKMPRMLQISLTTF
ncbi:hypothetical protein JCM15548_11289 [Geofilum rubicundum JCM 15548]|uniref:Uncharacterized protein n=1 Tax=Geofilum rubicundum JCM 15548 TaxID=1236989 RepID=A0A0E9LW85_9BACT|nr:hypothetical protein JCM15548_11289 [Geofilum rubicundum JCM 15548]